MATAARAFGNGMASRIELLCVERKLKMTGQRRVIARVLSDAADHPDVEELYRRASALDSRISVATVYRTVRLLEENGILERRDFGGGRSRYEATEHGHHHHLIDVETGHVLEFEDPEHERLGPRHRRAAGIRPHLSTPGVVRPEAQAGRGAAPTGERRPPGTGPMTALASADQPGFVLRPGPDGHFGELRSLNLGARIAITPAEVDAAQALRYAIFYEEMGAQPDAAAAAARRDRDQFDAVADHLLVVDHDRGEGPDSIVATYRLIRREAAEQVGRFYSADEFDLSLLDNFPGRVLELGRSCVAAKYRGRAAMQLLWRAIAAYVLLHRIELLFGCASLPGTDPDAVAAELTYLHYNHLAPPQVRLTALPERFVDMRRTDPALIDKRRTLIELPPLIKGYLRLGGWVGEGAVIDPQFNTTDVAVIVKTDQVTTKYARHFERQNRDETA